MFKSGLGFCLLLFTLLVGEAVADPNLLLRLVPLARKTDPAVTASTVATVTANQFSKGATIPPNFVGFSDETQDVIADTVFTPANTSLSNLISYWLGPSGVWRTCQRHQPGAGPDPANRQRCQRLYFCSGIGIANDIWARLCD